ncbi:hypothetical protein PM8797T_12418 [Gimesia maris DSM 8797]|nr:hypothetical protein PM8797T_12418 [Gimesia maris DSM 8797]
MLPPDITVADLNRNRHKAGKLLPAEPRILCDDCKEYENFSISSHTDADLELEKAFFRCLLVDFSSASIEFRKDACQLRQFTELITVEACLDLRL